MHDIADFLRRHGPFDALSEEALEQVAAAAEIEFFAAGDVIFGQAVQPLRQLRVVRTGSVELLDRGRILDVLGKGELFGHASMLSGLPTGFEARAGEDVLCYRWPEEVALRLLARPAGLRFVARSISLRGDRELEPPNGGVPADRQIDTLIRTRPVVCGRDTSIREAARRMTEAGATAVVVSDRDSVGILTDRDLRSRVLLGPVPADAPVARAMTPQAHTVAPDRLAGDVLLEMLDLGVRHLPVLSPQGEVLGVVDDVDLLAADTRTPFGLRRAIAEARDVSEVVRAAAGRLPTVVALHDAKLAPSHIGAVIAVLADAVTRRLLDLATAAEGPAPAPFAWLTLGSLGSWEGVPSSDVDCAVAWLGDDEDQEIRRYTRAIAARVLDGLRACELAPDANGVTPASALFARSLNAWRRAIRGWIEEPGQEKALILVSVMFDGRLCWGAREAAGLRDALGGARDHPRLVRLLARFALSHRPPTGFRRDIVVEHSGEHRGRFDIKHGGLLPIVDFARYASVAAGSTALGTSERLRAAGAAGVLAEEDARTLQEAFDLVFGLRLEHQVEQLHRGVVPDDHVDPRGLNSLTRRYLKEAFRAVASVQRGLTTELTWRLE